MRIRLASPAAVAVAVCVALVLACVWVWRFGFEWRDPSWRPALVRAIASASGRPEVAIGHVRARISGRPALVVEGLRIASAGGGPDWLQVGRLELRVDAGAWVAHRQLRIVGVAASDVLWRPDAPAPDRTAGPPGRPAQADLPFASVGVDAFEVDRLDVATSGAEASAHRLHVERIEGRAPADDRLVARVQGTLDGHAFSARLDAGRLSGLLDAARPWPVDVVVDALGANLAVSGEIEAAGDDGRRGLAGDFTFGVGTPDARRVARMLSAELPDIGATALAGRLRWRGAQVELRDLVGTAGDSQFEGALAIGFAGARPRIDGHLDAQTLDLRPFLGEEAQPAAATPRGLAQWYRDFAGARFDPGLLGRADARIDLRVGRWLGLPDQIGPARVEVDLRDGRLRAPMHVEVAGVGLSGDLDMDAAAAVPAVELALGTVDTPLGGLAEWLFGLRGLRGALGGIAMRAEAHGRSARELVDSTAVVLAVARGGLTYGNGPDGRPVSFGLDAFTLTAPAGQPVAVDAVGSLLGQPLRVSIQADSLARIARDAASKLELRARSRSVEFDVDGRVGARGAAVDGGAATRLSVLLRAGRLRDLSRWIGVDASRTVPLRWSARISEASDGWRLDDVDAIVASSRVRASVAQHGQRWRVDVDAAQIDVDELERAFAGARAASGAGGVALDVPVLPANVRLADLDLEVHIGRITRSTLDLSDLRFSTQVRDGRMTASPLSLTALGVPLRGALELDLRGKVPRAQWWLLAEQVDAGALLRRLQLADRVDARVDALRLHLVSSGRRLGDLLDAASLSAELEGGRIRLLDPNTRGFAEIELANGSLVAAPGQPLRGALVGRIGANPVALSVETGSLPALVQVDRPIPVVLDGSLGGARLSLSGRVERPLGAGAVRMRLAVDGERLDGWSDLVRVSLPPWGPYSLGGTLSIDGNGYAVRDLRLAVGDSSLSGRGRLDTTGSPPRLDVSLVAPVVSLDDFTRGGWTPFARGPRVAGTPTLAAVGERAARTSDELQQIFAPEVLRRLDATVDVSVDSVRSGDTTLGRGSLKLAMNDGRVRFDPVDLSIGEGSARLALDYAPAADAVDVDLRLDVDRLDYGRLARGIDPKSDLAGSVSARLALKSRAPALSQAMRHGNGSLRFTIRPRRLQANVFDLWATNLFVALITQLDPSSASSVNCGIGEFDLSDGVLTARRMLIDTTRVRVLGQGQVDFNDRTLNLRMSPWPKHAQFFSLATPVEVGGSFDAYTIGPRAGDVLATGIRLLGSVVWVPIMKVIGRPSPADGVDVCGATPGLAPAEPIRRRPAAPPAPRWGEMLGGP